MSGEVIIVVGVARRTRSAPLGSQEAEFRARRGRHPGGLERLDLFLLGRGPVANWLHFEEDVLDV